MSRMVRHLFKPDETGMFCTSGPCNYPIDEGNVHIRPDKYHVFELDTFLKNTCMCGVLEPNYPAITQWPHVGTGPQGIEKVDYAKYRGVDHSFEPVPSAAHVCRMCGQSQAYAYHVKEDKSETIADEAQRIVYGDREQTYDDPNRNFNKLAHMWTGHLLHKLKPGETITARDVAMMQVCLKISREGFNPKRDNRVDMVGYTLCLERIIEAEDNSAK